MEATIKLFKALPVKNKSRKEPSRTLLEATVQRGFVFSSEVISNYSEQELLKIAESIGRTAEQLNNSFHKSWKKVKEASIVQLVLEQILHYFTTYGFEALGVYDKDSVYIPNEQLDVPEVKLDRMNLVVIKGYTKEELKEKVIKLISSGVALKVDTFDYLVEICIFVGISLEDLEKVKNKEIRIKLYDYLDILPKDPSEFLRFLLYRTINETLLIKSKATIGRVAAADKLPALLLLTKYEKRYGLTSLSEIFNRFKPLFLAFRSDGRMNALINRISKLSKRHHVPMHSDYLNEVTSLINKRELLTFGKLSKALSKANTFRKIRLAYALKFRTKDVFSTLYKVRNGRSWATEVSYDGYVKAKSDEVLRVVLSHIEQDVSKNVSGKKIYLPKNVVYALPATEKQFTGNLPSGSYLTIDQDMVFGVHWFNLEGRRGERSRVDLDLSLISADGMKYGWDGSYRSDSRKILFSGDVTNAPRPKGASELFYLAGQCLDSPGIFMVNYFNYYSDSKEVPFEIVVAKHRPSGFGKNYVIDPNDIVCSVGTKIDDKQKILGIVTSAIGDVRFYFSESLIGTSITSGASKMINHARRYLVDFYIDTISLNEVLLQSGAEIVDTEEECDINLSLEKIEKDSILNLLS